MNKGKIIIILGVLLVIYVVSTPFITVYQMKSAAEKQDGEALSEFIEFPLVRQSFKDQMNALFIKKMALDEMKENPFAILGTAFAGVMIDKMVDAFITPAGITQMMAGEKPKSIGERELGGRTDPKPLSDISMAYESIDKFVVIVKGTAGKNSKFILRRNGLSWKLTEIILPLDD